MKSRTFDVRFSKPKDPQTTMMQSVIAETDMAAVAMAMYNVREDSVDWKIVSVTAVKES
jgi:hypothetical protein